MSLWRWYCSLLKPPSEKAMQRWQKMKARGKKGFVWRFGVLGWGGLMFVAMTSTELVHRSPLSRSATDYAFDILLNLLIWPIAGYFFGSHMWGFYETYFSDENMHRPTR